MRSSRPIALVVVLAWLYLFLAAIMNPSYSPPSIPSNPVMPFLTAYTVGLLWPLVLISFPIMMLAAQRLIHSIGRTREVSARDFARIQERARATREQIREDVRHFALRTSSTSQAAAVQTEPVEPMISSTTAEQKLKATEELLRRVPKSSEPEFTPLPVTSRERISPGTQDESKASGEIVKESVSSTRSDLTKEEEEMEAAKRIEELEAERAAMASLMDRLEDMQKTGAIQPELYDKLKKKYISELEKINAKVERLPVNEELKRKAPGRPAQT